MAPRMTLRVTVLGSSGRFATRDRACSGYLVDIDGHLLWMDAGAGTWRNLIAHCDYADLGGILLTHRHPDHVTDVFQAEHARIFGPRGPLPAIPLWAPAETLDRLSGYGGDMSGAFELRQADGGSSITFGAGRVSFFEMAHPPETVGVRIEHDASVIAYSADTGADADFQALAGGADIFFCEASNQDSDELWEGHLRASQAAAIARDVDARHLVLTHLPVARDLGLSLAEAQRESGDVKVELAADGQRHEVRG